MSSPIDLDRTSAYDYDLPEELIAQTPLKRRDASRMMHVDRASGEITHASFADLTRYVKSGDVLVINDTRVRAARTFGRRRPGGARCEIFFTSPADSGSRLWNTLVRPGRRVRPGDVIDIDGGDAVTIVSTTPDGGRIVELPPDTDADVFFARCGHVPLPPYIKHDVDDPERYQTVYADADNTGSCAAPTAGLHFTPELMASLEELGAEVVRVSLDVGVGTFRPVASDDISSHVMHTERCRISADAARSINAARGERRRIIAVGTTSVRTLETFAADDGTIASGERDTDIFIRPPYRFRAIDALITNFHLPKSTLLMLVSAFAGRELIMRAYAEAVGSRYRFFSFGDSMFIE